MADHIIRDGTHASPTDASAPSSRRASDVPLDETFDRRHLNVDRDEMIARGISYRRATVVNQIENSLDCIEWLAQLAQQFSLERSAYEDGSSGQLILSSRGENMLQRSIVCLSRGAIGNIGDLTHDLESEAAVVRKAEMRDFDARR